MPPQSMYLYDKKIISLYKNKKTHKKLHACIVTFCVLSSNWHYLPQESEVVYGKIKYFFIKDIQSTKENTI